MKLVTFRHVPLAEFGFGEMMFIKMDGFLDSCCLPNRSNILIVLFCKPYNRLQHGNFRGQGVFGIYEDFEMRECK